MSRATEQLGQGNIAIARNFLRRAAEIGLAAGALGLARTYDPLELGKLGARGVQPDVGQARQWYERARALGASEATAALDRLGRN